MKIRPGAVHRAAFVALTIATAARADHIEYASYGEQSPVVGGVEPLDGADRVHLSGADVRIALDHTGNGFTVAGEYRLENRGAAPAHLVVGIPLAGVVHVLECDEGDDDCGYLVYADGVARVPGDVELHAGATALRCKLAIPPGARWLGRAPETVAVPVPSKDTGWCVAEVGIPAGAEVALELAYHGGLGHRDSWREAGSTEFVPRRLRFAPFPGTWPGDPAAPLTLRVEAGRFVGLVGTGRVGAPGVLRWEGTAGTWTGTVQAAAQAELDVTVDVAPALDASELAFECGRPAASQVARASSTLPAKRGRSYAPANVLDGDLGTAWCEGERGTGEGAWIEVEVDAARLEGFAGWILAPGYARTPDTWNLNRRVRRLRIGPCGRPGEGTDVTLGGPGAPILPDRQDRATVLLPAVATDPVRARVQEGGDQDSACTRFTILETVGGPVTDACISTLRPLEWCRPPKR